MEIKLALIHDLAVVKSAICRHVIVGLHDTRIYTMVENDANNGQMRFKMILK